MDKPLHDTMEDLMKRILADKEEQRRINARKPWHEKIADIERVREAFRILREGFLKQQRLREDAHTEQADQ